MQDDSIFLQANIKVLQDQQIKLQSQISSLQSNVSQLMSYFGSVDEGNPMQSFAKELIEYFNNELKLTQRLTTIEKKQSESFIQFNERISQQSDKLSDLEPFIFTNYKTLKKLNDSNEQEALIKGQIETLMAKVKDIYNKLVTLDYNDVELKFQFSRFDTNISKYVTLNEMNNIQFMMQRDFISQIQLSDIIEAQNIKFERGLGDKADRQMYLNLQQRVVELEHQSNDSIKKQVDKAFKQLQEEVISKFVTLEKMKSIQTNLQQELNGQRQDYRQQFDIIKNQIQNQNVDFKNLQQELMNLHGNLNQLSLIISEKAEMNEFVQIEKKVYQIEKDQINRNNEIEQLCQQLKQIQIFLFSENLEDNINQDIDIQQATERRISQDCMTKNKIISLESEVENKVQNLQSQIIDMKFQINTLHEERLKETLQSEELKLKSSLENEEYQSQDIIIKKPSITEIKQNGCFNNQNFSQAIFTSYRLPIEVDQMTGQIKVECVLDPITRKLFESFNYYIYNNQQNIENQLKQFFETKNYLVNTIQSKLDDLVDIDQRINQKCDQAQIIPLLDGKASQKLVEKLFIQLSLFRSILQNIISGFHTYFTTRASIKEKSQKVTQQQKTFKCGGDKFQLDILMDNNLMKELKSLSQIQTNSNVQADQTKFFEQNSKKAKTVNQNQKNERFIPSARVNRNRMYENPDILVQTIHREMSNISIDQRDINLFQKNNAKDPEFFISSNKQAKRKSIKSANIQRMTEPRYDKFDSSDFNQKSPLVAIMLKSNTPKFYRKITKHKDSQIKTNHS